MEHECCPCHKVKVWCEHMKIHDDYSIWLNNLPVKDKDWKFCPICGKERS